VDKVVHFEIPFDNKERAIKFYANTFGWALQDMPQMSYVMARTVEVDAQQRPKVAGAINGGLFPRPKEAPNPVLYLQVDSIDATLEKVLAARGEVVTPRTPIPGMGAYARVTDTEGNIIGLFEAGS
jgi:uncharacterized protein